MTLAVAAALPQGPTARLTVDDATPAVGQTVTFNASASTGHDAGNGRIVAYRFSFGDGPATGWQTSAYADHAYGVVGAYVANVTVKDSRDQEGTASVTVRVGSAPPPPVEEPDLVPIQAQLSPATPVVNGSVNMTVVVLNRGGEAATAADLTLYDVPANASPLVVGTEALRDSIAPSMTASPVVGPFVFRLAGNHTLRIVVTNVTPPESDSAGHELDLSVTVLPATGPSPPGGGGGASGFSMSPLAVGLGGAAVAAGAGAALLFLRRPPRGPLEPPPPTPPDRSPPPLWPP